MGTSLTLLLALSLATSGPASAGAPAVAMGEEAMSASQVQSPPQHTLRGSVIGGRGDGTPLRGALVTVAGLRRSAVSDPSGGFLLADLPGRTVTLRVEAVGYRAVERDVALPAGAPLRIVLEPVAFELDGVVGSASPIRGGARYQPAQAFSGEALQRRSAASFGEMLDGEPGLAMRSFGPAPGRPVIRGLDGDRVLVLENGERTGDLAETAADHAISVDPLAAERVEVVRGPASLLYGSSALGGVVNVLSADIPRRWAPGTRTALAVHGASVNRSGTGSGTLTHGRDRWATTGRLSWRGADDLSTPEGTLAGTFSRRVTGAGGFGFEDEAFSGGASFGYVDHRYGLPEELDDPAEEVEIRMERKNVQGQLRWERGAPDAFLQGAELRVNASRYFHEEVARSAAPGGGPSTETVDLDFLQHALASTLTLTHGTLGFVEHGAIGFNLLTRRLAVAGDEGLTPDGRSWALASFVYEEMPLTRVLRLQAGFRAELRGMRAVGNERFPDFSDDLRSATISGSIGANVRPADGIEVGFQLARAHRAPMQEELYSEAAHLGTGAYEIGDPGLRSETGHGVDLFARLSRERVQAEVAFFHNRIGDYVILSPTDQVHAPSGFPVHRYGAADAELTGGEASVDALLTPRLRLRYTADVVRGTRLGAVREPLPFIPPLRNTVGAKWDADDWWAGSTVRFVGSQRRVAPDEDPTAGYVLVRVEAGWRHLASGRHVVLLRVDNALDTLYRDHLSRVENRGFPMPGRNVNLIYRLNF
jgi:iron complex outermembrane recepter protein